MIQKILNIFNNEDDNLTLEEKISKLDINDFKHYIKKNHLYNLYENSTIYKDMVDVKSKILPTVSIFLDNGVHFSIKYYTKDMFDLNIQQEINNKKTTLLDFGKKGSDYTYFIHNIFYNDFEWRKNLIEDLILIENKLKFLIKENENKLKGIIKNESNLYKTIQQQNQQINLEKTDFNILKLKNEIEDLKNVNKTLSVKIESYKNDLIIKETDNIQMTIEIEKLKNEISILKKKNFKKKIEEEDLKNDDNDISYNF